MNRFASVTAVALVSAFALAGCSSDDEGTSAEPEDRQTISGRLESGGDSGGIKTKTAGEVSLHVVAHRLGTKDHPGGDVDAFVAADGSFDLQLSRGARYVFEVERGSESVAFFGWNARAANKKTTALAIAATTKGKAAVQLGRVKIVGNGAVAENCLCDSFDESDTTGIDLAASYFVSAKGALITAEEALQEAAVALEEAAKALDEAAVQLDEAGHQLDDAARQAEEARKRAETALGGSHTEDGDDE